jgi:short-subunit dehydrogenase
VGLPAPSTAGAALVTGASSGIGAAIARELADRGHDLILVARREQRLRSLADELTTEHEIGAEVIACDLSKPDERERLHSGIAERGRWVEVLVNNAGFGSEGRFVDSDTARMVEMVEVNVAAVVDLSGRFLPGMANRGRGAVINIASAASFQPIPGTAVYAASKAFVLSFSEAIRTEMRGTGVGVTAVCPGPVETEFTEAAGIGGVEDETPSAFWISAEDVARHAVQGAADDKRVVVPGAIYKATSLLGQHSPRSLVLPIAERIWRTGTSRGRDR